MNAKINGTYDRTFIDGSELYVKLGDESTIIEHFADKWRVKPLSTKGQGKCFAWVAGSSTLESCSSCQWTVLDKDVWSPAPNVKMRTGRTWALLASWLHGECDSLVPRTKRGREVSAAAFHRTYETAASRLPSSASEPVSIMQTKSAKCAASFLDFFSRMSHAKALKEQAMSMVFKEQSNLALPFALPSTPEAFDRPPVESFAPTQCSPPKCDVTASGVDEYHGTPSVFPGFLIHHVRLIPSARYANYFLYFE